MIRGHGKIKSVDLYNHQQMDFPDRASDTLINEGRNPRVQPGADETQLCSRVRRVLHLLNLVLKFDFCASLIKLTGIKKVQQPDAKQQRALELSRDHLQRRRAFFKLYFVELTTFPPLPFREEHSTCRPSPFVR